MSAPAAVPAPLARLAPGLASSLEPVEPAPPSGRFSWLVTGACTWILVGLFVDGWFHVNDPGLESFFTPWHALLYSGVAAAVVVHLAEHLRAGGPRPGYGLSLVGGLVVSAAGFVDMVWHTVLGVEEDLEALLSPPHLLLITAGTLVFAGPVRAALVTGRAGLPAAICSAYVVTGLAFFTQYANPFTQLWPVEGWSGADAGEAAATVTPAVLELREVAGVAGVVLLAALVGGAVALVRALDAPPGSLAVVVAVPVLFVVTLRGTWLFVPAALLAAVLTELLGRRLRPAALAGAACALLFTGWAASLLVRHDVAWSAELLAGSVCSAAAAGYLAGWLLQAGARRAA